MKQFLIFLFAPLAAAFPPFYIHDQQYRYGPNEDRCKTMNMCYDENVTADHPYSLNFIEVNDKGKLVDENQLEAAKAQLRSARANGQTPTVFIYVHGWHNDANKRDQGKQQRDCSGSLYIGDVDKFRHCGLEPLASTSILPGAPRRVVGIYLAWHGTDFNWPPFTILPSYPFRRYFAQKVGLAEMQNALSGIFDVINEDRDSYFVIAMGHSFGARVLEASLENIDSNRPQSGLIHKYRDRTLQAAPAVIPRLPVDLIFYVNAATSHSISIKTIRDWKQHCASQNPPVGCDMDPLYLAVSSRADWITALVMPLANLIFFSPVTDQYHLISAANTPWMQTHNIPRPVKDCSAGSGPPHSFCFGIPASPDITNYHESDPKPRKTPALFWALNSDHWIASVEGMLHDIPILRRMFLRHWVISSHGDVWNVGVFNMIKAVIDSEESNTRKKVQTERQRRLRP